MKLQSYLTEAKLTVDDFAAKLGVHRSTVTRYLLETRLPDGKRMRQIAAITDGKVTANDFFGIAA